MDGTGAVEDRERKVERHYDKVICAQTTVKVKRLRWDELRWVYPDQQNTNDREEEE